MDSYARIVGGLVVELIPASDSPLAERYHPDIVAACVRVPDDVAVEVGFAWDGTRFSAPPAPAAAPPAPPIRQIAPLSFRRRMGAERRAAVTLAASRMLEGGDATLQAWLDDLAAARVVDLDDAELRAGVEFLVFAKLLSAGEAEALLADGTPDEV